MVPVRVTSADGTALVNTDCNCGKGLAVLHSIYQIIFFVYGLCMDSCKSKWIRLQKDHTTFANPHGHFAFTRQPFGLRSLPITFSGLISLIMQGLIGDVAFHLLRSLIASKNIPEPRRRKLENKCQKMSILLQTLIQACDLPSQERHSVHMDW